MSPSGEAPLLAVLDEARRRGFLGPGPLAPHLHHARGFRRALEVATGTSSIADRVLDLGSGGGLPGLVLAADDPQLRVVLLDAAARRCTWLRAAIGRLHLDDRVEVAEGRGEDLARSPEWRERFEAVVARSFGPPAVTAEIGGAFLRIGGHLVVSEPPEDEAEQERWPADGLAALGLELVSRPRDDHGYAVLRRRVPVPDGVPRRSGIPAKRPRW